MKKLPTYLLKALQVIRDNQGDDIYFAFSHVSNSVARSYVSKLRRLGLAYTYVNSGTTEVCLHKKGEELLKFFISIRLNNTIK